MQRAIVPIIVFASVGLLLSIVGLVVTLGRGPAPQAVVLQPDDSVTGLTIPDFSFVDHSSTPRTHQVLDGNVTIMDFIFTNCPFACPMMTGAMTELQTKLAGTPVKFLSISVDPEHDTPEALMAYAGRNDADLSRWTFLTGNKADVERVVKEGLKFELGPDEDREVTLPDGSKMANIQHPTRLFLVGPDRRLLGMYDPNDDESMRMLEAKARVAARSQKQIPR
jgi:protein SCO1/2